MKSISLVQFLAAASTLCTLVTSSPFTNTSLCGIPSNYRLVNNTKLPDLFTFIDGRKVRTAQDWECRKKQIFALIQRYESGWLPPRPEKLTGNITQGTTTYFGQTYNSTNLNINATNAGKTITFSASLQYPTTGTGPFPAIIAYGGPSIPVPAGVVTINLDNDLIGLQNDANSRGQGLFFDLYGANATASAMTAWAWAVSRIIDVLEEMPSAKINTKRIAVTGCSRNGKGALVAGAFDDRIALTIPQESGSGGDACWRLSDAEQAEGFVVQTSSEIVNENVWFSEEFDVFSQHNTSWLPFDHHSLAALIAPRPLLSIENTAYVWLSPESSYGCMKTAHKAWEALGVPDHMGFTQDGNHSHCAFPADQQPELTAFFNRFLLDIPANTTVFKTTNETFNASAWIDWKTPKLTGRNWAKGSPNKWTGWGK